MKKPSITVNINISGEPDWLGSDDALQFLAAIEGLFAIMSQALDDLTAAVTSLETTAAATVTAIDALKATSDDAALAALTTRVGTVTTSLTTAIAPPAPTA